MPDNLIDPDELLALLGSTQAPPQAQLQTKSALLELGTVKKVSFDTPTAYKPTAASMVTDLVKATKVHGVSEAIVQIPVTLLNTTSDSQAVARFIRNMHQKLYALQREGELRGLIGISGIGQAVQALQLLKSDGDDNTTTYYISWEVGDNAAPFTI